MKKYMKYFIVSIFAFVSLLGSVNATTIKETTINGDAYDTIEDGSIVIGVTKFDSDVVITGARATKAGSNDAIVYMKLNSSLEGYNAPVIYIYAGGAWFALDESNNASVVEDTTLIDKLSNNDIYFVNNEEKMLDIDVSGMNIDETKLPKGVTYKDGKVYVPATTDTFSLVTKDGIALNFVKDGTLFAKDQSECYTLNGNTITSYNQQMCGINVSIPTKINDVSVNAIAADAFKGKEIETVIIPGHINSIGDNAFADNNLKSVTIEEKYDSSDFELYGNNVFGTFTDIKYKNELTELLDQFKDHLVLNVREGLISKTETIDGGLPSEETNQPSIYILPAFAEHLEFKRLGLKRDDEMGYVNGKYSIYLSFKSYNGKTNTDMFSVRVEFYDESAGKIRNATKDVSYEIKEVKEENTNYKKIIEEYKAHFVDVQKNIKEKKYSQRLTGYTNLIDISDKYDYEIIEFGYGDGGGGDLEPNNAIMSSILSYNDTLYDLYDVPFYASIEYEVSVDSNLEDSDLIYKAMEEKFASETDINDYEVLNTYGYANSTQVYIVELKDNKTQNSFRIIYDKKPKGGSLVLNYSYSNQYIYTYYPKVDRKNYEGSFIDYVTYAFNELNQAYNTGTSYYISHSGYKENEEGKKIALYNTSVSKQSEDGKNNTYTIYVENATEKEYTEEIVEYGVNWSEGMTEEEYNNNALKGFIQSYNLVDYYVTPVFSKFVKNEETNKFVYADYTKDYDVRKLYTSHEVIDFKTNTKYIVVYKCFENREPGTLYLYQTSQWSDTDITYTYKYVPNAKYIDGKVTDYIEVLKKELSDKLKLDGTAEFSVYGNMYSNNYTKYTLRYSSSTKENEIYIHYSYEVDIYVPTDSMRTEEYYKAKNVDMNNYENEKSYEDALLEEYLNFYKVNDYYNTHSKSAFIENVDGTYRYFNYGSDDEKLKVYGYEIIDFENNKAIYLIAIPFNKQ